MRETPETAKQMNGHLKASAKPRTIAKATQPLHNAMPPKQSFNKKVSAGSAASPDTVRLICVFSAAIALGIACGVWINARLASAASTAQPAQSQLLYTADSDRPKAAAPPAIIEPQKNNLGNASSSAIETIPSSDTEVARENNTDARNARGAEEREVSSSVAASPASGSDAPKTSRGDIVPVAEAKAVAKATPSQGRKILCPLYASAGALTIRNGGSATIVLGGASQQGGVVVTTPNWSDIAVFSEGRASSNTSWVKFSVRSVSKRPGVFSLHVKTACGSLNVPVTVARP